MVRRVLQTGAALRILTCEDEGRILISTVSGDIRGSGGFWVFTLCLLRVQLKIGGYPAAYKPDLVRLWLQPSAFQQTQCQSPPLSRPLKMAASIDIMVNLLKCVRATTDLIAG